MRIEPHHYSDVNPKNYGVRIGKPPGIVIHHSDSPTSTTADDINTWHLDNGWNGIGYHAVVYPDGRIIRGRPYWAIGAHCFTHNDWLGICFIGTDKFTDKQLAAGAWLVKRWRTHFGISQSNVRRHRDMSNNSTACPGKLPMGRVNP